MINRIKGERGATVLEFGLSALMLMLVIFGVFEMCRMMLVYNTVAYAARVGARYAAVNGSDVTPPVTTLQIQTTTKAALPIAPIDLSQVTVNVCYSTTPGGTSAPGGSCGASDAVGNTVAVTVSYNYYPFIGFFANLFGSSGFLISNTANEVISW